MVIVEPAVDRVPVQVGGPLLVVSGVWTEVMSGVIHQNMWAQPKPAVRAVDVLLVVGVGVVPAVVGHPADRPSLGGAAADGSQDVFEPTGPGREAAVGQEPVIGQADADAAGQPVQDQADGQCLST